jgi:hypothetical protein
MNVQNVFFFVNLVAFRGYDLNGDGCISREELRLMFQAYFAMSMDLVRGAVKVMEEGMLDSFDDEAAKPVSAAFGAPSTQFNQTTTTTDFQEKEQTEEDLELIPMEKSRSLQEILSPNSASKKFVSFHLHEESPKSLDLRPAPAYMRDDDHLPIVETISKDAIEEMINQVFLSVGCSDRDSLDFTEFCAVVEQDVNILSW